MYKLCFVEALIPLKNFYAIRQNCVIEGELCATGNKKYVIKKGIPHHVAPYSHLENAEKVLETKENMIRYQHVDNSYYIKEWFILNDKDNNTVAITENYRLISEKGNYKPEEVRAMKQLLEHMGFYQRLSTIIAYEKYGYLVLGMNEKTFKSEIQYEDERQVVTCNVDSLEIKGTPKTLKNEKRKETINNE
ncbi:MAG: hypothetical protein NC293_03505 [Roseburia sp.]|nr:hypothetical protein [Roseburia sp.]